MTKGKTRIGFGKSRVLRVETTSKELVALHPDGLRAKYSPSSEGFILYPETKGKRPHWHEYPDGVHRVSIKIIEDEDIIPFRIGRSRVIVDEEIATVKLPRKIRPPQESGGNPEGGGSHYPLSHEMVERLEETVKEKDEFDPTLFNRLLGLVKDYAWENDVQLCVDPETQTVYGRIEGT